MSNRRTYAPNADDLLRYSFETGEKEGSRKNQILTNEGREQQGARSQQASIAKAQFAQHAMDRNAQAQAQRDDNATRLFANQQDNAARLQAEKMQGEQAKQAQLHDLNQIEMRGDVEARNKALEHTGGLEVPDATDGLIQNYDVALANQDLFNTATGRDRHALQQKFSSGDPQAIQAALASGRARLSAPDAAALKKAQAALARADTDTDLHPQQRVMVQRQKALEMQGITRRAQWLPDESQPKTLQEQFQSRVVVLNGADGKPRSVYMDAKGNAVPFHKFDAPPPPVDPNAPKPPKTLSADEKKIAFRKQYNDAQKALTTQHPITGVLIPPDQAKVLAHMKAMDAAYNQINSPEPQTMGEAVIGGVSNFFGVRRPQGAPPTTVPPAAAGSAPGAAPPSATPPAAPGAPPAAAPPPGPSPKKMEPVYVGERTFDRVGTMKSGDGKEFPIIEIQMPGSDKPHEVVLKDGRYMAFDVGADGKVIETGEYFPDKFDAKNKPKAAPEGAVYVNSTDHKRGLELLRQGKVMYDEKGKVFGAH